MGADPAKLPGHWVLARLGKRVLRPGGIVLTKQMLGSLAISPEDDVVEFAPGMGHTARLVLEKVPASYTAVERDPAAADRVRCWLDEAADGSRRIITGQAQDTRLPDGCASVVFGEAMLTMQPQTRRRQIIAEAFRLLKPGGRYGVHELGLQLDDHAPPEQALLIRKKITDAIHHQAYPMRVAEWQALLEAEGFEVQWCFTVAMALLEPGRLIRDEGWAGAARFAFNVVTHGPERRRVRQMRHTFRELREHLVAVSLVAHKPGKESA
ncbi:MAG: class I SAM-dependent methyltransferase [Phycisphaeraceae bacterium]|nr:class I SAM-dependent methyltransferase [Phycisphaeraceae bacterium]